MNDVDGSPTLKIALIGNPNSGKSTVFNQMTGLRQRTGNFPGVTVEVKEGTLRFPSGHEATLFDFPGTYSLYPTSSDEKVVASVLTNPADPYFPDAMVYVADVTKLEKHLLLFTQLLDLNIPLLLALNLSDSAAELGIKVNASKLSESFGVPVIPISGRTGHNTMRLILELEKMVKSHRSTVNSQQSTVNSQQSIVNSQQSTVNSQQSTVNSQRSTFYPLTDSEKQVSEAIRQNLGVQNPYRALLLAHHSNWLHFLNAQEKETVSTIVSTKNFQSLRAQVDETLERYDRFIPISQAAVVSPPAFPNTPTDRIDAVLTHRLGGPLIFFTVMMLVFQAIFDWSVYPMDWIESGFALLSDFLTAQMPAAWYTELITDGILAGLGGILVFVPQIAILFLLISILEEVGYMSRVVFMFDKTMRRFGMNGRSMVSLISGSACAVPAIMSSRTIGNWQERLITVMVTPFISCSARIPVYLVLIGLAVPAIKLGGVLSLQSLVFGAMYVLGVLAAFATGWIMKHWLHRREHSFLAIELPVYRMPHWKNVLMNVWEKVKAFMVGAGKIILVVSIALWGLSRFGPGDSVEQADRAAQTEALQSSLDSGETQGLVQQRRLEASWAGQAGKVMEPAIRPLGYDWKIGIALLTSFAAREVFTGTLAVLYNMGGSEADINDRNDNEAKATLRERMKKEKFGDTGKPVYSLATALSLLVFYALSMQCFSTLAVVRRETGSWKWAALQFTFMSIAAYLGAWAVYALFS
ncbi:MAG: ferrous iron transport protein B [Phycisphaerae bacterium]|nr:ferrous iron transport protein B [Saprospiraceae bacterium]